MRGAELEEYYRQYIRCLNERRLDEMPAFYHDELLYNGRLMSRAEWQATAIEATFDAMPDFAGTSRGLSSTEGRSRSG